MRIILDTNIVVSFAILAHSRLGQIVNRIIEQHTVLYSEATFAELARTLSRPKLARYLDAQDIELFLRRYEGQGERVQVAQDIRASRDPDDDKFLALALDGHADCILTGDADLLALHPFRDVEILTVEAFAARYSPETA